MGAGASLIAKSILDNPQLANNYREEIAILFSSEMARLKDEGRTEEEAQLQFAEILKKNEMLLISRVASKQFIESGVIQLKSERKPNTYESLVKLSRQRLHGKKAINFMVCVDGSDASDAAFKTTLNLRNKYDHITLFHAYCESDELHILPKYRHKHIRDKYQSQLVNTVSEEYYTVHMEERHSCEVIEAVRSYIALNSPKIGDLNSYLRESALDDEEDMAPLCKPIDFVVFGKIGCRGLDRQGSHSNLTTYLPQQSLPPTTEVADHPTLQSTLGATVDFGLRSIALPCIIVKYHTPHSRNRSYVMAVDESDCSKTGLDTLLLLLRPRDSLRIVHIVSRDAAHSRLEKIQEYYTQEGMLRCPAETTFVPLPLRGCTMADVLCEYSNGMNADFLCMAPRALGQMRISSMTESIIAKANSNIILCKN
jgi:23S rRNA pseudoU1915 N3-methylase RlmH